MRLLIKEIDRQLRKQRRFYTIAGWRKLSEYELQVLRLYAQVYINKSDFTNGGLYERPSGQIAEILCRYIPVA